MVSSIQQLLVDSGGTGPAERLRFWYKKYNHTFWLNQNQLRVRFFEILASTYGHMVLDH